MLNSKVKKTICGVMAIMSLMCTGANVFAGTIPYDITVGGSGTQDPLSMKELKDNDGDQYAYFSAHEFSRGNAYIYAKSYKFRDEAIDTDEVSMYNGNVWQTQRAKYRVTAPGGAYYYMSTRTNGAKVNVTGNYCP